MTIAYKKVFAVCVTLRTLPSWAGLFSFLQERVLMPHWKSGPKLCTATNNQFSDKFNDGWKKIENGRFIVIFRILSQ